MTRDTHRQFWYILLYYSTKLDHHFSVSVNKKNMSFLHHIYEFHIFIFIKNIFLKKAPNPHDTALLNCTLDIVCFIWLKKYAALSRQYTNLNTRRQFFHRYRKYLADVGI